MPQVKTGVTQANGINFHFLEMGVGPLVVCVHGFPDNAYTYRYLLPELAEAGFRAVAPYTRGYAPTEAPKDARYQTALVGQDGLGLIEALGASQAALVGHDWGGFAVYSATALEPKRVSKLVTIATAPQMTGDRTNLRFLKGIWHGFYFLTADAERTLANNDFAFLEDFWRDLSPGWDIPPAILEGVKRTFRQPGVSEAALGYYRQNFNSDSQDPSLREVQDLVNTGPISVPTLALHGTRDRAGALEVFQEMDHFFTGPLEKVVIPNTGHFMHLEKPDEVNQIIVKFLRG